MINFDHFSRFQKVFRQKMQGLHKIDRNSREKLKGEKLKSQAKTQGFCKIKNAVCRNSVEKKAALFTKYWEIIGHCR